ncbi:MAG: aspartate aminotransferase family protein [Candidatus Heimdallarchaeota archaeon]
MEREFSELHFPEAPKIVVDPPGPKTRVLLDRQRIAESKAVFYPVGLPLALEAGKGATLRDVEGNYYIDLYAGISVLNVGHSNPVVLEAVRRQEEKLVHTLDFPSTPRVELAEKLGEIAPGNLRGSTKILFGGPTGSDAVEGAIKLARFNTQRRTIISFEGSYHGQTAMALSLTSSTRYKENFVPLAPEVHFVPYAYCYRCFAGLEYPACGLQCAKYIRHIIEDPYSGVVKPAAILVEPIQGEGGIIVPPNDWLPELRKICTDHSIPLIIDEIQAGFGRTGKMFACEHSGTSPDIMTMAKAIGGIGYPLAAIAYHKDLDTWEPGAHVGTFRGHVLAMAASLAAINYTEEKELLPHCLKLGRQTLQRLRDFADECKSIGEVRGKGLMIGLEFVKDKETKEPWKEITSEIQLKCLKKGVLVWKAGHFGNCIRFLPPLVITSELLDTALYIFEDSVKEAEKG